MNGIEFLKAQAQAAHQEVLKAIEGVTQAQAWSVLPQGGPDYIHTDGSIHGITLHIATCKFAYGSIGVRDSEIRWRNLADEIEAFEPDWDAARQFLDKAHRYWIECWSALTDEQLEEERPHFSGRLVAAWKLIDTVTNHDHYHAAQIALLRYAVGDTDQEPPSQAEDIRTHCRELPSW